MGCTESKDYEHWVRYTAVAPLRNQYKTIKNTKAHARGSAHSAPQIFLRSVTAHEKKFGAQVARGALRKTFESAEMLVDSLSIWGGKQPL